MDIDKLIKTMKTFENIELIDFYIEAVNNQSDFGRLVTETLKKIENKEIGSNKKDVLNYLNKIDRTSFRGYDNRILDKFIFILSIRFDKPIVRMFKSLFEQAEKGVFK